MGKCPSLDIDIVIENGGMIVFQRAVALVSLVLGLGTIMLGLIIGSRPDPVSYQHVGQEPVARFITAPDGTGYLQMVGDPTIYILNINLFSPKIDSHWLFSQGYQQVGIIYDKNQVVRMHAKTRDTGELIEEGEGYGIVSITFMNDAGAQQTFDTEQYKQHPDDYNLDYWPIGLTVIGIGIILIRASAGLSRLKEGPPSSRGEEGQFSLLIRDRSAKWHNRMSKHIIRAGMACLCGLKDLPVILLYRCGALLQILLAKGAKD